jgi:hypothetical protein
MQQNWDELIPPIPRQKLGRKIPIDDVPMQNMEFQLQR